MTFVPKDLRTKDPKVYKTVYISEKLVQKLDKIASDYNTSFNNVVISMIEYCLEE